MSRRFLIAGNWKMHHGIADTTAFVEALVGRGWSAAVDVLICPPFLSLPAAAMVAAGSPLELGVQNVHWDQRGAYTGEIAAGMVMEAGARFAIVGHSERRTLFGESDVTAARRALAAEHAGLTVVYCIGETLDERDRGETFSVLERQTSVLAGHDPARLVVAYEPVWAIGTGHTARPEQAQEAHAFVRRRLATVLGDTAAGAIRILYGGSMKAANANELLSLEDVDGGLIGGASLDVDSFSAIIRAAADCAAGD